MNKISLAATVAAALATFALPAAAQDQAVSIAYGDLDVSSAAGAQLLIHRFDTAVDAVCTRPDVRDIKSNTEFNACKQVAVAGAVDELSRDAATVKVGQLLAAG